MNFNLVEMYNGLLRFNKHILNELAEGRIIYRLPYYPDRIAHHAIMNVVKYILDKKFYS